jgi:hypothetical protein
MTLIEQIVKAMIDYDIDEQHTVGELLHAIRVGEKDTNLTPIEGVTLNEGDALHDALQEDTG